MAFAVQSFIQDSTEGWRKRLLRAAAFGGLFGVLFLWILALDEQSVFAFVVVWLKGVAVTVSVGVVVAILGRLLEVVTSAPRRWWREHVCDPSESLLGAFCGLVAVLFVMIALANYLTSLASIGWLGLLAVMTIGGVCGAFAPPIVESLFDSAAGFAQRTVALARTNPQIVGTVLLIAGVGLLAAKLPETFGYAVAAFKDEDAAAALTLDEILVGLAAMMIAGGWFLRKSR